MHSLRAQLHQLQDKCVLVEQQHASAAAESDMLRQDLRGIAEQHAALAASEAVALQQLADLTRGLDENRELIIDLSGRLEQATTTAAAAEAARAQAEEQAAAAQREVQRATRLQLQYAGELRRVLQQQQQQQQPEDAVDTTVVKVDGREVSGERSSGVG